MTSPNPADVIRAAGARAAAEREQRQPEWGVFTASSCGYQPRRIACRYDPAIIGWPLSGRAVDIFSLGDWVEERHRRYLHEVWPRIPVSREHEEEWELPICEGWVLRGHPDGVLERLSFRGEEQPPALLEIKSASSYGFRRLSRGELGDPYLGQITANLKGLALSKCLLHAVAKESMAFSQTLIPFREDLWESLAAKLRAVGLHLNAKGSALDLPACRGEDYGIVTDARGWTGKRTLRWGCSYCPFWGSCYPEFVQVAATKPVVLHEQDAPPDARVIRAGLAVDIEDHPDWTQVEV